jgi:hypothetical protein
VTAQELLQSRLDYMVLRSERGNEIVRRDPRELPRRIRVLLLAIDGSQTVGTYVSTLRGFGDVAVLLSELFAFGLIELKAPYAFKVPSSREPTPFESSEFAAPFTDSSAEPTQFGPDFLDSHDEDLSKSARILDDWQKPSREMQDILYGDTSAGSFNDLLRVARANSPHFKPPPPPAPVSPTEQKAQIQSVFILLDAVRGERKRLREQVGKLQKFRAVAMRLHKENTRLTDHRFMLGVTCTGLTLVLMIMLWLLTKR